MASRKHPSSEFDAFLARTAQSAAMVTAGIAGDDPKALAESYRAAVRLVFGILAALILDSRDFGPASDACRALREVSIGHGSWTKAHTCIAELARDTHVDLLKQPGPPIPAKYAGTALQMLLAPETESALGPLYFSTIPTEWLSSLYERLLGLHPRLSPDAANVILEPDPRHRKRSGSFFTPPFIVDYIVTEALAGLENSSSARILDPSMGGGDFLLRTLSFLAEKGRNAKEIAEDCLFGCDIDPIAVDIARFLVWLQSGGKADAQLIAHHLICADALGNGRGFGWQDAFPDAFALFPAGAAGFDAVVGNPPYVAAKNVPIEGARGQSDYYLLFLQSVIENELVRPGGKLAMVLPDPFLARGNAAHIRRILLEKWTVDGVIHIKDAFPGASVANIVLSCSNRPPTGSEFPVVRLDKADLRRRFEVDAKQAVRKLARMVDPAFALAQPKAEVLYLVDDDKWKRAFERIHGPERSLSRTRPPFAFLEDLNIEATFRGEEIGKQRIVDSDGDLPMLLGGESIRPYKIEWEGRRVGREAVAKPMEWYQGPKLLLQKSSAKLVAAFDETGFIVPQSLYGIKLALGSYSPLYLLALLNSRFLNDYVFRAFTGYKLVQPQLELEDIRRLPIRTITFNLSEEERKRLDREGHETFNREFAAGTPGFPELCDKTKMWLTHDMEEAVHDLLSQLAGLAVQAGAKEESSAVMNRLRSAIDAVVDVLYGSHHLV